MDEDEDQYIEAALALCRGVYQRALILGQSRVSGADLKGKAREYAGRYKRSRDALFMRVRMAGIPICVHRGDHGFLSYKFSEKHVFLENNEVFLKEHNPELHARLVDATHTSTGYAETRAIAELYLSTTNNKG